MVSVIGLAMIVMRMMMGEGKETAMGMGMMTRGRTEWVKKFYKKRK
jgi:hypothetical protein